MDFPKREDWLELLSLTSVFDNIYDGSDSPDDGRAILETKKTEILNIPYDHIAAIRIIEEELDRVDEMITDQNRALRDVDSALSEIGLSFNWDRDKLLSDSKKRELESLQAEAEMIADEAAEEAEYWEEIAEEAGY